MHINIILLLLDQRDSESYERQALELKKKILIKIKNDISQNMDIFIYILSQISLVNIFILSIVFVCSLKYLINLRC